MIIGKINDKVLLDDLVFREEPKVSTKEQDHTMKKQKIEITLEEYKELLEIKGKYEEIKKHPIIQYVYVYDTKPYVDITPNITWKVD